MAACQHRNQRDLCAAGRLPMWPASSTPPSVNPHASHSQAADLRAALGLLPTDPSARSAAGAADDGRPTTVFRLVYSEGDALSGLVVDVLGDTAVVQSNAAWAERYKSEVVEAVRRHSGAARVVWRRSEAMLAEEGVDVGAGGAGGVDDADEAGSLLATATASSDGGDDGDNEEEDGAAAAVALAGAPGGAAEAPPPVRVREAGVAFLASPEAGQKTGFYADQRDNRAFVASMARGKTVLDLCCYSGGFALAAAAAGAQSAIGARSRPGGRGEGGGENVRLSCKVLCPGCACARPSSNRSTQDRKSVV